MHGGAPVFVSCAARFWELGNSWGSWQGRLLRAVCGRVAGFCRQFLVVPLHEWQGIGAQRSSSFSRACIMQSLPVGLDDVCSISLRL